MDYVCMFPSACAYASTPATSRSTCWSKATGPGSAAGHSCDDVALQCASGADFDPRIVDLYAEVCRTLRDHDAIDGIMRAAMATLIVELLQAWPEDRPIRVHTENDDSGRRYGPRAAVHEYVESVHVVHRRDGHYASTPWADLDPAGWLDCGAEPNSFFEAAMYGLLDHDPRAYTSLVESVKHGRPALTDAQCLRDAILAMIEQDAAAAMEVLKHVLPDPHRPPGKGPVDGQLLLEIRTMEPASILAVGRRQLAERYNVLYNTLRSRVAASGDLTPPGWQAVRKFENPEYQPGFIDPESLGKIAEQGLLDDAALLALAGERHWSLAKVFGYFDPGRGLSSHGRAYLERAKERRWAHSMAAAAPDQPRAEDSTRAITAPVLQDILRKAQGRTPWNIEAVALDNDVPADELRQYVNGSRNLTAEGMDLLERGRTGPTVPLTHDVLRELANKVARSEITTNFHLWHAARERLLAPRELRKMLHHAHGLTVTGRKFLETPWTLFRAKFAVAAARAAGYDVSRLGAIPLQAGTSINARDTTLAREPAAAMGPDVRGPDLPIADDAFPDGFDAPPDMDLLEIPDNELLYASSATEAPAPDWPVLLPSPDPLPGSAKRPRFHF